MCWFSGPASQKNVGGMREDRWENKIDLTSFSIQYFERARVVVHGDGGLVLVIRSCATKECGWNAGGQMNSLAASVKLTYSASMVDRLTDFA
ncbi:hypothetical protein TNCV_456701 [Trichonephila clavipes]|uniref:Uncharacterized protein n=1 Tax=Trichonephila clavipes TaxID=2585209 RepID=A0A8X6RUL0_TRICX|nr:hypothetical protein TNCV_456701 [Trichonephila clavipes]